jgi:hypothetical protein
VNQPVDERTLTDAPVVALGGGVGVDVCCWMLAKMDVNQENMDAWLEEMKAWRKETTACQEVAEDCLEQAKVNQ